MSRQVHRSLVPVSGALHVLDLTGPIVHVGTRGEDYVELWHIHSTEATAQSRGFCVFGTGGSIPEGIHLGTAITPSGRFVWHLFELAVPNA